MTIESFKRAHSFNWCLSETGKANLCNRCRYSEVCDYYSEMVIDFINLENKISQWQGVSN